MKVTIGTNRKRFPIVFLISLLFAVGGGINITRGIRNSDEGMYWWTYGKLLIPLFYCVISLLDFTKTRFDENAVFIISDTGLDDNLSIFSCGKIPWADIKEVQIGKTFNVHFLVIHLFDNKKYLSGRSYITKYILVRWIKKWGSPVVISEKRINCNLHELKGIILDRITNISNA